jgi:hypothetical protein
LITNIQNFCMGEKFSLLIGVFEISLFNNYCSGTFMQCFM